jgi:hypothetical protein
MTSKQQHAANPPYAIVGAGPLVSHVWKRGDERSGWFYRYNIFRVSSKNGRVSQLLAPTDIISLAKLSRVLALALLDDGCTAMETRRDLAKLADILTPLCEERDETS